MTTKIEITQHNGGCQVHVGYIVLDEQMTEQQVGDIANESGGMADLLEMGRDGTTVPAGYEWTGDEVYEII